ncbi:MAG TPA: polysaccharide deacetylase family protein [Deltaproteobacteria bacterium]|nr:polysaccharide deacetylase family protein [Deltaproteobacteria bacterium]
MKKKALAWLLYYSGVLWLRTLYNRIFGSKKLIILAYHRVLDIDRNAFAYDEGVVDASVADFEWQMKFVSRHFDVITFGDLDRYATREALPKNPLIITFDDGYKDNYTNAYPILKKYGLPAVIFLATGHIGTDKLFWWDRLAYLIKMTDRKRMDVAPSLGFDLRGRGERSRAIREVDAWLKTMGDDEKERVLASLEETLDVDISPAVGEGMLLSWDDVEAMSEGGVEFGAHTDSHRILTNISSSQEILEEIEISRKKIEEHIGRPVISFAYPSGKVDERSKELLAKTGLKFACTCEGGSNPIDRDPLQLRRFLVNPSIDRRMFAALLLFPSLMSMNLPGVFSFPAGKR